MPQYAPYIPHMFISVASGMRCLREKQIITPVPVETKTFGDMEIAGYLFPLNDNIIWASPLLSTMLQDFDRRYPAVKQLISAEGFHDEDIGDPLENYLVTKSSDSFLRSIVFARENAWKSPGEELARTIATTLWIRYCVKHLELTSSFSRSSQPLHIELRNLIEGLPNELINGIMKFYIILNNAATVAFRGVIKLKLPSAAPDKLLPKEYIYINGENNTVFFWATLGKNWILVELKCKNG